MSSLSIKALLPSPRYTCHVATYNVLRNIRNLTNCVFKAVNAREGVSKNLRFQVPHKKSAAIRPGELGGHCHQTERELSRGMQQVGCSFRVVPYGLWHRPAETTLLPYSSCGLSSQVGKSFRTRGFNVRRSLSQRHRHHPGKVRAQ